jgi:hypothetical protein
MAWAADEGKVFPGLVPVILHSGFGTKTVRSTSNIFFSSTSGTFAARAVASAI